MADEEARSGKLVEQAENKEEERRAYKCQYCDRMFTSSQALGGHQNGHRRERDAAKSAEHEAELYHLQAPPLPMFSPPPYLHANQPFMDAARSHYRPWLHPPYRPLPRPSYYQPYHLPYSFHSSSEVALRTDPRYTTRHSFLASPCGGHVPREEQWRPAYWQRNHNPRHVGYPRKWADEAQAAMEGPSTSTNLILTLKQSSVGVKDGKNGNEEEIDLTLHL